MGVFTPVELDWKGTVYTIKPHRVMGMISRIEDTLTFEELKTYCARGAPPMGKLCIAYAAALQYAGAQVSGDEVYEYAFSNDAAQIAIMNATIDLMKMMLPPIARARLDAALAEGVVDAPVAEGREPANPSLPAPPSSRKRSKQRSQRASG